MRRRWVGIALLVVVGGMAWWSWQRRPQVVPLAKLRPDIEFKQLVISQLVDGEPTFRVKAQDAAVYLQRHQTQMTQLRAEVPAQAGLPAYQVSAQTGVYEMDLEQFHLNQVTVESVERFPLWAQASDMRWQPGDELLQLQGRVSFRRTNISGQAENALANLRTQHVSLWNGVQARLTPL